MWQLFSVKLFINIKHSIIIHNPTGESCNHDMPREMALYPKHSLCKEY